MKVNSQKNNISFQGVLSSRFLKRTLEFAADNGSLFAATTTLLLSTTARPLAILATPNTDKKNKKVACSKSIASAGIGYLTMLAVSLPFTHSIQNIDKNPNKYLSKDTISKLKEGGKNLTESKGYQFATQMFKLGLGFVIAAPKSILTAITTPMILEKFDKEDHEGLKESKTLMFKGKNPLSSGISAILNKEGYQNFVNKFKDTNFPLHIISLTDLFTTFVFTTQTKKSKKLHEKDKKPLIYNSFIATGLSIISSYIIDFLTKNSTDKFIEKYKRANKNDINLAKQIEGIKIAKPMIILGLVYYIFIPMISTFWADRIKPGKV